MLVAPCESPHRQGNGVLRRAASGAGLPGVRKRMEDTEILRRLELLRVEHRDLDAAIEALAGGNAPDQLQIARLKKRKLRLRDEIAMLEDRLIPDIIA
jgi:hypothetical protein